MLDTKGLYPVIKTLARSGAKLTYNLTTNQADTRLYDVTVVQGDNQTVKSYLGVDIQDVANFQDTFRKAIDEAFVIDRPQ